MEKDIKFWGKEIFSASKEQLLNDIETKKELKRIFLSDKELFSQIAEDAKSRFGIELKDIEGYDEPDAKS